MFLWVLYLIAWGIFFFLMYIIWINRKRFYYNGETITTSPQQFALIFIVGACMLIGLPFLVMHAKRQEARDPIERSWKSLSANFDEYRQLWRNRQSGDAASVPLGRIAVVPCDEDGLSPQWTKEVHRELPYRLRAMTYEEVETVVLIDWSEIVVGSYKTTKIDAIRADCKVKVIDKDTGLVLGNRSFRGTSPPRQRLYRESAIGKRPTEEIVSYIRELAETGN